MRLIDSSESSAVPRADAMRLINERLVLANAVCAELDACQGNYANSLPAAALDLLRQWVGAHYEGKGEVHASDGLDEMVVPPEEKPRMADLRTATVVCEDLAMLWTADLRSEFTSDSNRITQSLGYWRTNRSDKFRHG